MKDFQRGQEAVMVPACLLNVGVSVRLQPLAAEMATLPLVASLFAVEDKLTKALVLQ